MTATLKNEVTHLRRANAELQRKLDERTEERDEALRREAINAESLRESLEHQIATSDVLKVISRSVFDLQPVLETLAETAARLCAAEMVFVYRREGEVYRLAANCGFPPAYEAFVRDMGGFDPRRRRSVSARAALLGKAVHVHDVAAEPDYASEGILLGKIRTAFAVPLLREGAPIGVLGLARQRVEPFTESQIALVTTFADQAAIAIENARLITETREALQQQTATAEVLQVINSSPGDLAPVFDAMLDKALRLCEAATGNLHSFDGEAFHLVASCGTLPAHLIDRPHGGTRPIPGMALDRIVRGEDLVHIEDVTTDNVYASGNPMRRAFAESTGARTALWVALRKDDALLGVFVIYRQEVRSFTDNQIALLQNFAAQAVIAMENARLISETQEALDQQTATAEVLGVINSSPGDLAPVFDATLERATRLSDAAFGVMQVYDGEQFRTVATRSMPPALAEFLLYTPRQPSPHSAVSRILAGEDFVHFEDMTCEPAFLSGDPRQQAFVNLGGTRTYVAVALRKEGRLLGTIGTYRQEVRPFTDKQIALLQNFAAQAVIAMENARLITETQEALEQQTATAEVLQVINSSPGNLDPVFDAVLEKATVLCEASFGILMTYDGEIFQTVALRGVPAAYSEYLRKPIYPAPQNGLGRLLGGERLIHIEDIRADEAYRTGDPLRVATADLGGSRTHLVVPLLKDDTLLGAIVAYRQEVRPFTDKQIALLQNFAAQAVIAMENARLLTETREALEQQTATAEVLQIINSSPGDLAPVFDAMLEKATRLCEAVHGHLATFDGEFFRFVAVHGGGRMVEEQQARGLLPPSFGVTWPRLLRGDSVVHVTDVMDTDLYRTGHQGARWFVDIGGGRTCLTIALRKEDALLGALTVYRREVRPFTDKQIALLENFAAQAVIAMENARLLTETREALEQQTATAEVLQVINSSPGDLAPVFDAMLEKAVGLCDAAYGVLRTFDGEFFHLVAMRGEPDAVVHLKQLGAIDLGSICADDMLGRIVRGEEVVHIADVRETHTYRDNPIARERAEAANQRTWLAVALRKDATLLGVIMTYRAVVRPFSDKQIALLQNFATQAVIAMENARLITETREALEQQTATAEVLQVINSSPGNLAPVFDAMLERATRLCEAEYGLLGTYGPEGFRGVAALGLPMGSADALSRIGYPPAGTSLGRVERTRETVQIVDIAQEPAYAEVFKINPWLRQVHSNLVVPLLKDDELIGVFILFRGQVRPFTDKQIALVQSFAAQAVIAMENARLLEEIRQRQQELRVTFDNMVDGVAMFDEALRLAAWNRNFQELLDLPEEFLAERHDFDTYIRYLSERGEFGETDPETQIKRLRDRIGDHYSFERTRPDGTVIEVRHNPMPDGGVVLIYSDITERKRSEAEIRAARDAAEAAYLDLKAAQASLIQAEKMASLGQLTAGIAHEIKNPLNFVNNFAGLSVELLDELKETAAPAINALGDEKRAEVDETITMLTGNLEKIAEHGRRADGIVKSMLEHSRGTSGERRSVDLNGLIEEALNLAYHGARAQDASFNITLERDFVDTIAPMELVPQDITRVCLNLFGNGFYAATKRQKEGGDSNFKPTLKVSTRDLGDAVEIRVHDNGIGIPPEIKDKLFQPFFTTKPTGEGTGLGLSISYDIVTQQHGGTITVDSQVGEFTEFTVRLPRAYRATMAEAAS